MFLFFFFGKQATALFSVNFQLQSWNNIMNIGDADSTNNNFVAFLLMINITAALFFSTYSPIVDESYNLVLST